MLLVNKNETKNADELASVISLGSMEYNFVDDKPAKRTDADVQKLRTFLTSKAASEGCPAHMPAYERVVAHSTDESQVLLKYGCGAADSPMFAVKTDDMWKSISPTNQFDNFGIPGCEYLTAHNISKDIAPVCVVGGNTTSPSYQLR